MHPVRDYYDVCCRYRGKQVRITDLSGVEYRGRIVEVDERFVYLEQARNGFTGYGYGFPGYYYRPVFPIALAAIGGFALGAAFFWW